MLTKKKLLLFLNFIFVVLLFYLSGYRKITEVHIVEFIFFLNCLLLYISYGKRNSFFLTYLLAVGIAQFLFVIFMFNRQLELSITGGIIFLIAYASMIFYIFKEIEWQKMKKFSIITASLLVLLMLWIIYNINHMMLKERTFEDLENAIPYVYKIMIYAYFIFIAAMIFLGFLNLSIKVNSWSVLFCLGATCALSSEFLQIFQLIHYRGDAVGSINIMEKAFSIASLYFFYCSIDNRKNPDTTTEKNLLTGKMQN